ncbi:hypothetical protein L3i22_045840 [Actinoplanes sp. L3-i22]|nr:hypothetical protein L3i22_045840 [Actinoplanes sp. L3-i22]
MTGATLLALLGTVAGCSDDPKTTTAGQPAASAAASTPASTDLDACALLDKTEVEAIIGASNGGQPGAGVGDSLCVWENPTDFHSVTVNIGVDGTAPKGKLPADVLAGAAQKGPDGIRFAADSTANFVLANRACYLQVVTETTDKADRATAARLIALIRTRTAGKL